MNIHPPIGGSSEEEGAKTGKLRKKTKLWFYNFRIILFSTAQHASKERKFNDILMRGGKTNNPCLYVVFPPLVRKKIKPR